MNTLGKRLRDLREQLKITQEDLGKAVNVGKTTISNYETDYSNPDKDTLVKLADTLDCSTDYLLGRTDDPSTRLIKGDELPQELKEVGIEYMEVWKEAKASDITPEDIREIMYFIKKNRNKSI